MLQPTTERDLLLCGLAMEQGLITPDHLARAIQDWRLDKQQSLMDCVIAIAGLSAQGRQRLQALVEEHGTSSFGDIAESLDGSLFGKLQGVLNDVGEADLRASVDRWMTAGIGEHPQRLTPVGEEDRFQIVKEHARGGLGEVLLAEDRQLNRRVALKQIRDQWADHEHANIRFQQEAEITGRLEHPGIVPVYALGTRADGRIYYAMRFIKGESLEQATNNFHEQRGAEPLAAKALEFRNLLRRFTDVCNTISYAHSRGILHRDLKPANIMLGKYGETLVVDWGLAKQIDVDETESMRAESLIMPESGSGSAPTQYGSAVGTPQYMSPEQAAGRLDRMGPSTDVFGLGATLYHILTNRPPQSDDSIERILDRVEHGEFPRPREIDPGIPRSLEAVCLKALATRPSDRYPGPRELELDLERWLADEPVSVYSDPLSVRLGRWTRRHRALAMSSIVATFVLVIASIAGTLLWSHFQQESLAQQLQWEAQQGRFEREQLIQEHEIKEREQQRLAELDASARAAEMLANEEIRTGRFSTALSVLDVALHAIADEPRLELEELQQRLQAKVNRLRNIVRFYRLAEYGEETNFLSRDTEAMTAITSALDAVGVWDHGDWWANLPADDLSPVQLDDLRLEVYRQLVLLSGLCVKFVGTKTLGSGNNALRGGFLRTFLSKRGREEAKAAIVVCELAQRFRLAESLRWYRGMAGLRIARRGAVSPSKLDRPQNAADAYGLAILNLIAALDSTFPFRRYRGVEDSMRNAREVFELASDLDPDHYWTHLSLGHVDYLMAERAAAANASEVWEKYAPARKAFGRCIALRSDLPFAYADVSTVCLRQMEAVANSAELTPDDIQRIRSDLNRNCLTHAERAVDLATFSAWPYWHYGHALQAAGRTPEAVNAYLRAIELTYRFTSDSDAMLVDVDDFRGRSRAEQTARDVIARQGENVPARCVIAGSHLLVGELDAARKELAHVTGLTPTPFMWAISGIVSLRSGDLATAQNELKEALQLNPDEFWAVLGLAECEERTDAFENALQQYDRASDLAVTDYHRAAALLGVSRTALELGDNETALNSLRTAIEVFPACDRNEIERLAEEASAEKVLRELQQSSRMTFADINSNSSIKEFSTLAVLNGDFELELARHWGNLNAPVWATEGECVSRAAVDGSHARRGHGALRVLTTQCPSPTSWARTTQVVPAQSGERYGITVWAKSDRCDPGGLSIAIDEERARPVIALPTGRYHWQQLFGEFEVNGDPDSSTSDLVPVSIQIVSQAKCDIWLDEIEIKKIADSEPE